MKFIPLLVASVAAALALGLSACGKKKNNPLPPKPAPQVLPVMPKPITRMAFGTNMPPPIQAATKTAAVTTKATPTAITTLPPTNKVIAAVAKAMVPVVSTTNKLIVTTNAVGASNTNKNAQAASDMDVAFMALEQSKPNVAIGIFTKLLQKDPANRRARFGLSTALIQAEKYKEALAILEDMVKEVPRDYVTKNNLAWIYATANDLSVRDGKRAVQLAQEALLLNPTDCHVWSTLSEAYFICGRYDKAMRDAEHALRLGQDTNADAKLLEQYQLQVERCRKAAESMAILE